MSLTLSLVVALAPCAAPALAPSTTAAQEPVRPASTADDARPAVVVHGGDAALRERLRKRLALWHDAGPFLVGALSPDDLRALGAAGVAGTLLPAIGAGEELLAVDAALADDAGALAAVGARALFAHGGAALLAAPAGAREALAAGAPAGLVHGGVALVPRAPLAAQRPFRAPRGGHLALGVGDPRVQALVDLVEATGMEATVQSLAQLYNRCAAGSGAIAARDQLVAQLQAMGYAPALQAIPGGYAENVLAELPGLVDPDRVVVVGGHYDSWAGTCSAQAPGADDDGSGTAGVLEAARVLIQGGPYEHTVRLALFSAEEYGLYGSDYASAQSVAAGEDVIAMLNLDMIAYRAAGDARDVDFVTNDTTPALRDFCDLMGTTYVPGWASTSGPLNAGTSDHRSYYQDGFPAVFYFEDVGNWSPYIHSSSDTYPLSANDFALAEMTVKGVVAAAATLAAPVDLQITHAPLPDTQSPGPYDVVCQVTSLTSAGVASVELHYAVGAGPWSTVAMLPQGSDWVGQIPDAGSPVELRYWLAAFDDQGGMQVAPEGADVGGAPYAFFVGVLTALFFDDFEAPGDGGWTHGADATQDDWQHGAVYGKSGDPSAAWSGTRAWGNDLGGSGWNGAYQNDVSNWLRSPVLDLSGTSSVLLRYRRWLTIEDGLYDQAQIRVNGAVVWQNSSGGAGNDTNHTLDGEWTLHTVDLSAQAAGDPAVQLEFRLLSDGGLVFGGWNLDDVELVSLEPIGCPPPASYCTTSPNSLGAGAQIGSNGATSVAANAFALTVQAASASQPGIFYYGPNQISLPYGDGVRCVGGGVFRLPPVATDALGDAFLALDLDDLPPGGGIAAGSEWNFQFWYRDPAFGGSGFNLSDGLHAVFCP